MSRSTDACIGEQSAVRVIPFNQLNTIEESAIVVTGAGGPPDAWVDGLTHELVDEGLAQGPVVFSKAAIIDGDVAGAEGGTDLLLIFSKESKLNLSDFGCVEITLRTWREVGCPV